MKKTGILIILAVIIVLAAIFAVVMYRVSQMEREIQSEITYSDVLYIYNWEDYLDPEVISGFEAEYGVTVFMTIYEDEDEIITTLQNDPSSYDVIFPSAGLLVELLDYQLVAEINTDNIPNLANLAEEYQDPWYDPGSQHSVAYAWGFTPLIYNQKYVAAADSWSVLTDPALKDQVGILNNNFEVVGMGLKASGFSLDSENEDEFYAAKAFLQAVVDNGAIMEDPITMENMLIDEQLWAAQLYSGEASMAAEVNPNLVIVVPEEGAVRYTDVVAVPIGAPHKNTAELFLNYILRPEVHGAATNFIYVASPNQASFDQGYIDQAVLDDPSVYPDRAAFARLEHWPLTKDSFYIKVWAELLRELK